jgi:hypothetical protein
VTSNTSREGGMILRCASRLRPECRESSAKESQLNLGAGDGSEILTTSVAFMGARRLRARSASAKAPPKSSDAYTRVRPGQTLALATFRLDQRQMGPRQRKG